MNKPYTYIIFHNNSNEFYIGSRTANRASAYDDLWRIYFTSSKLIKERIKDEGTSCFTATIIDEFDTPEEAFVAEQLMISERINDPLCLNKTYQLNGKQAFLTTGTKRSHSTETRSKISKSLLEGAHRTYERTDEHLAVLTANGKQTGGWNKGTTYKHTAPSPHKGRVSPRKGKSQPKYPCPHCERTLGGLQNLNKHITAYHS
jgi:hypothetical protein|tara:strand:- start:66 stop:674 length:609 start_codon:yes stop_codon:yes gene_type:complete